MWKKIIILCLLFATALILQFGFSPLLNSSFINNTPDGYDLQLSVTANCLLIFNRDKFAYKMIEKTLANDFQNMQFCYEEYGYPCELNITVYVNKVAELCNKPAFSFRYVQDIPYQYNVKEAPEQFELIYY